MTTTIERQTMIRFRSVTLLGSVFGTIFLVLTAPACAGLIATSGPPGGEITFGPNGTYTTDPSGVTVSGSLPLNVPTTTINEGPLGNVPAYQLTGSGMLGSGQTGNSISYVPVFTMSSTGDRAFSEYFGGQESTSWGFDVTSNSVYLILSSDGEITGNLGSNSEIDVNIFASVTEEDNDTGVSIRIPYTVTTPGPFHFDFDEATPLVPWPKDDPSVFTLQIIMQILGTGSVNVDPGFGTEATNNSQTPEPPAIVLFGTGAVAVGAFWRRRRRPAV
jgi:hypothetical protein